MQSPLKIEWILHLFWKFDINKYKVYLLWLQNYGTIYIPAVFFVKRDIYK